MVPHVLNSPHVVTNVVVSYAYISYVEPSPGHKYLHNTLFILFSRMYKVLPEVKNKQKEDRTRQERVANRLKAKLFNKVSSIGCQILSNCMVD